MPHQNKHKTAVLQETEEFYRAMLALLPLEKWHELHDIVRKTHYWEWQFQDCTTFTVAE